MAEDGRCGARLGRDRATPRNVALGVLLQATVARKVGSTSAASIAATLEARCRQVTTRTTHTQLGESFIVTASLHPAGPPVELRVGPQGNITANAETSTVGPGYHEWVCEWLAEVGEALSARWEAVGAGDASGWFITHDRARLEAAFLAWLTDTARLVVERVDAGVTGLAVSLPVGDVQFLAPGFTLTPLGPRDEGWWRQAATDAASGVDLFPWWAPGRGAHEQLGRAQSLMWTKVAWRAPLTPGEQRMHDEVLALLAAGHAREPGLDWPWREWLELLALTSTPPGAALLQTVRAHASQAHGPLLGYLRHDVRVTLAGGWSVRVPGAFARALEPDGVTVRLGDGARTVFVMTGGTDPELKQAPLPKGTGERLRRTERKLDSAALVTPQAQGWQLVSNSVVPGELAVVTVQCPEADREWALQTWRSIAHPGWRR